MRGMVDAVTDYFWAVRSTSVPKACKDSWVVVMPSQWVGWTSQPIRVVAARGRGSEQCLVIPWPSLQHTMMIHQVTNLKYGAGQPAHAQKAQTVAHDLEEQLAPKGQRRGRTEGR